MTRLYTWLLALSFLLLTSPAMPGMKGAARDAYDSHRCENFFNSARPLWEFSANLNSSKLAVEIAARRKRVREFQLIAEEAKKRGLRAWLFGGTAASYSHYVKWDLLRENGNPHFQSDRFDYDYTHIYRSTQDLDIVINGGSREAQNFQQLLEHQFPYFSGGRSAPWEVRSLKDSAGDKGGLLEDFGFMNQHTDSNSTGMVELTDPPPGESVVRDLRDWNNRGNSQFLEDIFSGTLTFYYSPRHHETPRAQVGKNPTIFSVIRALIKAFQYDLKLKPSDIEIFKKEVLNFNPKIDLNHPYAAEWVEKNGKKLFQNAVNIEYAWDIIESIGLRKKLISIKKEENKIDSLSWWMNKEPLRSKPVGDGEGRTAEDLGLTQVAHETSDFMAYESITRSHIGAPNVFISRQDFKGETAYKGDGFYASAGKKGLGQTGITVRFRVNPKAREWSDFLIHHLNDFNFAGKLEDGDFIIWKNKNALEVIPESLNMSSLEYFQHLLAGNSFTREDRAILWKFKRHLSQKLISEQIPSNEIEEIRKIIKTQISENSPNLVEIISEWIRFESIRLNYPDKQVEHCLYDWKHKNYLIDPIPLFTVFTEISKNTSLEDYITKNWLVKLAQELKMDIGDRTLEASLFSQIPEIRNFGLRTLRQRQAAKNNLFTRALQQLLNYNGDVDSWLKSKTNSSQDLLEAIEEKASYVALHPEKRGILESTLPHEELKLFESALRKQTFLPTFESLLNGSLPTPIKSESFQFISYEFPPEGKKVTLGSPPHEQGRLHRKEDQHDVIFTQPFQIQATPVTQLQWTLIMGENPSQFKKHGTMIEINGQRIPLNPNHPIDYVSWIEAQIFIEKLNKIDPDFIYRLPTEAEWEFVARAGTITPFSHGEDINELQYYAWTLDNSGLWTHEVASLKPNPDGLYDIHGNVLEWVYDRWNSEFPGLSVNPTGPMLGDLRVLRGGSGFNLLRYSRSANREYYIPDRRRNFAGFRLVRTPSFKNRSQENQ